jgi:hypothetical protein
LRLIAFFPIRNSGLSFYRRMMSMSGTLIIAAAPVVPGLLPPQKISRNLLTGLGLA